MSRSQLLVDKPQPVSNVSVTSSARLNASNKSPYQAAQQVKFLHLQAEVESLLHQLQFLKQQRIAATSDIGDNRHS